MKKLSILIVIVSIFACRVSFAQTGVSGFDTINPKYPADGSGTISIAGSKTLKQWQPHVGINLNLSRHLLSATRNNVKIWMLDYMYSSSIVAAVGLFDFLSAGVEAPASLLEGTTNVNNGVFSDEISLGDIRFDVKGRILKDKSWWPGIAVIPSVFFPSGDTDKFTGNTGFRYQGLLVVDKDFGPVYVSLNAGYRFVEKKTVLNTIIDDQILYSIGISIPLPVWEDSLSIIAEANGSSVVRNFSRKTTGIDAIGGFRKSFDSGLNLYLGGGGGIIKSIGVPDFRILAGAGYTLNK